MIKQLNDTQKIYLAFIFVVVTFLLLAFVVLKIIKENSQCTQNPFTYASKKLADKGMENICYCLPVDSAKYTGFYFDENDIYIGNDLSLMPGNLNLNFEVNNG